MLTRKMVEAVAAERKAAGGPVMEKELAELRKVWKALPTYSAQENEFLEYKIRSGFYCAGCGSMKCPDGCCCAC